MVLTASTLHVTVMIYKTVSAVGYLLYSYRFSVKLFVAFQAIKDCHDQIFVRVPSWDSHRSDVYGESVYQFKVAKAISFFRLSTLQCNVM